MKGNIATMQELIAKVEETEKAKHDVVIDTRELTMYGPDAIAMKEHGTFRTTDYASGQIADRLGIPRKLWKQLGSEYDGLREDLVNGMWHQKPERRFVRALDYEEPQVRAFLSDRYHPMDNMLLLSSILPVMHEYPDVQVTSLSVTPIKTYVQIVFPRIQGEVLPGDVIQAGAVFSNSEVGAGAWDFAELLWRLECGNGMVGQSIMRKYHVGSRIDLDNEESYNIFEDDTIRAEVESLRLRMRDVFKTVMNEAAFEQRIAKLRTAADDKVADPLLAAKNVTEKFGLREEASGIMLQNMAEERNYTRYGLANSLTWYAQQLDDRDRQFDLEKAGSAVIDMPPREWKQIIEAA